jgi:hypothetical protein
MENAVSYLTILLNDLEQVKNSLSTYNNTILILIANHTSPGQEIPQDENFYKNLSRKMDDNEKVQLATTISYFRAYATRAYIGYKSIAPKLINTDKKNVIEETYKIIKTNVMPPYDVAENFVQALNDIFVIEINVQALINTAQKSSDLSRLSASPQF